MRWVVLHGKCEGGEVKPGDLVEYVKNDSSYNTNTYGIIICEEKKIWGESDFTSYKVLWGNCEVFSCYWENIRVII